MSDFDDIDEMSGFDDYGMDFDMEEPEDDRSPVAKLGGSALKEVLSEENQVKMAKTLAKNALPEGYNDAASTVADSAEFARGLYDKTVEDLKGPINELKKEANTAIENASFIPDSIKEKLLKFTSVEDEDKIAAQSEEAVREASISSQMESMFGGYTPQGASPGEKEAEIKTEEAKLNVEDARFKVSAELAGGSNELLNRLVMYNDQINYNFQKKSFELQQRQLFAQQDLLKKSVAYFADSSSQLKAVVKNTGLPEFVKVKSSEAYQQTIRDRFVGNIADNASSFFSGFGDKLKENITSKVEEFKETAIEGIESATDGLAMLAEMMDGDEDEGGPSKEEMIGAFLGDKGSNFLVRQLAEKVIKPRLENDEDTVNLGHQLKYLSNNPEALFDIVTGKTKDIFGEGFISSQIESLRPTLSKDAESVENNLYTTLTEPVPFDEMTRRSIVEVIPGFLSRILKVVRDIHTGGDTDLEIYSAETESFVSSTEEANRVRDKLFSGADSQLAKSIEIVRSIDNDNELTEDQRIAFAKQLNRNANEGESFDIASYAKRSIEGDESGAINEFVKKKYELTDEEIDAGPLGTNRLARINSSLSENYRSIGTGYGDIDKTIGNLTASGNKDIARLLGITKNDDQGKTIIDHDAKRDIFNSYGLTEANLDTLSTQILHSEDLTRDRSKKMTEEMDKEDEIRGLRAEIVKTETKVTNDPNDAKLKEELEALKTKLNNILYPNDETLEVNRNNWKKEARKLREENTLEVTRSNWRRRAREENADSTLEVTRDNWRQQAEEAITPTASSQTSVPSGGNLSSSFISHKGAKQKRSQRGLPVHVLSLPDECCSTVLKLLKTAPTPSGEVPARDSGQDINQILSESLETIRDGFNGVLQRLDAGINTSSGGSSEGLHITASGIVKAPFKAAGKMASMGYSGIKSYYKGLGNIASSVIPKAMDIAGNITSGAGSLITGVLGKGKTILDVKVRGNEDVSLSAMKMKAGEYFDSATGKIISSVDDIKGEVKDRLGNIVLSAEDFKKGLTDGLGNKIELNGFKDLLTNVGKGLRSGVSGLVNTGMTMMSSTNSMLGSGLSFIKEKINEEMDIYIPGEDTARLLVSIMKRGGYVTDKGTIISSFEDIDGDVYSINDKDQTSVLLSMDEVKEKGIVNRWGSPIENAPWVDKLKTLTNAGMNIVKKGVGFVKDFNGKLFSGLSGAFDSTMNWFSGSSGIVSGFTESFASYSSKTNNILEAIFNYMNSKWGDAGVVIEETESKITEVKDNIVKSSKSAKEKLKSKSEELKENIKESETFKNVKETFDEAKTKASDKLTEAKEYTKDKLYEMNDEARAAWEDYLDDKNLDHDELTKSEFTKEMSLFLAKEGKMFANNIYKGDFANSVRENAKEAKEKLSGYIPDSVKEKITDSLESAKEKVSDLTENTDPIKAIESALRIDNVKSLFSDWLLERDKLEEELTSSEKATLFREFSLEKMREAKTGAGNKLSEAKDKILEALNGDPDDENNPSLKDKLFSVFKPKKKVLGDEDGDGLREGGWRAMFKRRKENKENESEDEQTEDVPKEEKSKGFNFGKLGAIITGATGLIGGLFDKVGEKLLGGFWDATKGLGKSLTSALWGTTKFLGAGVGKVVSGLGSTLVGSLTSMGSSLMGSLKSMGNGLMDAFSTGGIDAGDMELDDVLEEAPEGETKEEKKAREKRNRKRKRRSKSSRGKKGFFGKMFNKVKNNKLVKGIGKGISTVASVGLKYGGKALSVAGKVGGTALRLATGPVGLAIGAGMLAYEGYKLYDNIKYESAPAPLDLIRFKQYGINVENKTHLRAIRRLEEEYSDNLKWSGNTAELGVDLDYFLDEGILTDEFGLDDTNQSHLDNWTAWFTQRFFPIVSHHVTTANAMFGAKVVSNISEKIKKEQVPEYLKKAVKYSFGGINVMSSSFSPFEDEEFKDTTEEVRQEVASLLADLPNKMIRNKTLTERGIETAKEVGTAVSSFTGIDLVKEGNKTVGEDSKPSITEESIIKKDADNSKKALAAVAGSSVAAASYLGMSDNSSTNNAKSNTNVVDMAEYKKDKPKPKKNIELPTGTGSATVMAINSKRKLTPEEEVRESILKDDSLSSQEKMLAIRKLNKSEPKPLAPEIDNSVKKHSTYNANDLKVNETKENPVEVPASKSRMLEVLKSTPALAKPVETASESMILDKQVSLLYKGVDQGVTAIDQRRTMIDIQRKTLEKLDEIKNVILSKGETTSKTTETVPEVKEQVFKQKSIPRSVVLPNSSRKRYIN